MMEDGSKEICMGKANTTGMMVVTMMDNIGRIKNMELECITTAMGSFTVVDGRMVNSMDKELSLTRTGKKSKVNGLVEIINNDFIIYLQYLHTTQSIN